MHSCPSCCFSSSSAKELESHSKKHRIPDLEPVLCHVCGARSFSSADHERHVYESHEGPKQLPRSVALFCKSCDLLFDGETEFDHHIINHVS